MMKRTFIFIAMAVLEIGLAGCTKNEDAPANSGAEGFTVMGTICDEGAETKVGYTDKSATSAEFHWTSGDAISVTYHEGSTPATGVWANAKFETSSNSKSGAFTESAGQDLPSLSATSKTFKAVYPYSAANYTFNRTSVDMTLPVTQLYNKSGALSNAYMIAVQSASSVDGLSFNFVQAMSVIRVKFSNMTKKAATVHLSCNEAVFSTKAGVALGGTSTPKTGYYVKDLYLDNSATAAGDKDYVDFVIFPTNLTGKTIYIEVSIGSGYNTKYITKTGINFERNQRYDVNFDWNAATSEPTYISGLAGCTLLGGIWWADQNLGYDENQDTEKFYGLLYQWGRKAGQGYNTSDGQNTPSHGGTFTETGTTYIWAKRTEPWTSIAVPDQYFFYGVDSWISTDYLSNSANRPLWDNTNGTAQNNPCPAGWRVPTLAELSSLGNVSSGSWKSDFFKKVVNFGVRDNVTGWVCGNANAASVSSYSDLKGCLFLPAAGARQVTGVAGYRDSEGGYWSCETGTYGKSNMIALRNNSAGSIQSKNSFGSSVRCVKML